MKFIGRIKRNLFGVNESSVQMEVRGFMYDNDLIKNRLELIGRKFLFGYHNSLYDSGPSPILEKLYTIEPENQGFSFEGAAMGMALLDTISIGNKSRLKDFLLQSGDPHAYMMHVGAGWAYAKLPVNVEKKMEYFDPLLRWLIMDGFGFCNAYFNTKKYVIEGKVPDLKEYSKHVFYQGLGRCLWFVEGANPERITSRISCFSKEYFGDLWSGVGLASAYAGGVEKEVIEKIKNYGSEFILNIGQGAAFAAKTRIRAGNLVPHTDLACMIYSGIDAKKAAEITDISLKELTSTVNPDIPTYEIWRRNIFRHLSELSNVYA